MDIFYYFENDISTRPIRFKANEIMNLGDIYNFTELDYNRLEPLIKKDFDMFRFELGDYKVISIRRSDDENKSVNYLYTMIFFEKV